MKTQVFQLLALFYILAGCSEQKPAMIYDTKTARAKISASLPSGWKDTSPSLNQSQLTALYFTNLQTQALLILGTQSNHVDWIDRQGLSHSEPLAVECLDVWIVPSDFKPSFEDFNLNRYFFGAELPKRIYSSGGVRVYGLVSQYISDTNRWATITKEATTISSPALRLSWTSWKRDIVASLNSERH